MNIVIAPVIGVEWREAGESWPADATIIPIPGHDIAARWRVTEPYWAVDDLWFIEQDNILLGGERESFEQCPEIWCLYQYYAGNMLFTRPTGCARFRKRFMEIVTLDRLFTLENYGSCWRCQGNNPRCYAHIDGIIAEVAIELGLEPHVHGITGHRTLDNPWFRAAIGEQDAESFPLVA